MEEQVIDAMCKRVQRRKIVLATGHITDAADSDIVVLKTEFTNLIPNNVWRRARWKKRLSGNSHRHLQAAIKGAMSAKATCGDSETAKPNIGCKRVRLQDSAASSPGNPPKHAAAGTAVAPSGNMNSTAAQAPGTLIRKGRR
uniref:Uncharacterized protein n=1 Tax=Glossina austeni TaxID=7395 RepID=A0A1A9UKW4_GLOAU